MSKVLYIKTNAKPEGVSRTFKISDQFAEAYKAAHPGDEIITLDLYKENIKFLTEENINSIFGPKSEDSKKHPILRYAYQFMEADKIIVAAPLWNLSIPAMLKAYIDYISVSGITFKYTAEGPVGLCKEKKAVHIAARGGEYSEGAAAGLEMGDRYLRTIFGFFGITDFITIAAEKMDVIGEDIEGILKDTIEKAVQIAENF